MVRLKYDGDGYNVKNGKRDLFYTSKKYYVKITLNPAGDKITNVTVEDTKSEK